MPILPNEMLLQVEYAESIIGNLPIQAETAAKNGDQLGRIALPIPSAMVFSDRLCCRVRVVAVQRPRFPSAFEGLDLTRNWGGVGAAQPGHKKTGPIPDGTGPRMLQNHFLRVDAATSLTHRSARSRRSACCWRCPDREPPGTESDSWCTPHRSRTRSGSRSW